MDAERTFRENDTSRQIFDEVCFLFSEFDEQLLLDRLSRPRCPTKMQALHSWLKIVKCA